MSSRIVPAEHLLEGIVAVDVDTPRLLVRVLVREDQIDHLDRLGADTTTGTDERVLVLTHGNLSSSLVYQRLMLALADRLPDVVPIAPDFRGFGETEPLPTDATQGLREHAADILGLLDTLGIDRVDLAGWSMGGGVAARIVADEPGRVRTLTLLAPIAPYGFGGTVDVDGTLSAPDAAGSGAGGMMPRFVQLIAAGDPDGYGTPELPEPFSPRGALRWVFVAPTLTPHPDEALWLTAMFTTRTGPDHYPGDAALSWTWPGYAPGRRGVLNAMAPLWCRWDDLGDVPDGPPVLWIRGGTDLIVSDHSTLDLGVLGGGPGVPAMPAALSGPWAPMFGLLSSIPWLTAWFTPWAWLSPPVQQPMVAQTRAVLERYRAAGADVQEVLLPGVGHSAHLEAPGAVLDALAAHLADTRVAV